MKAVDLTKILKPYKSGWIAVNQKKQVIAHEKTFVTISNKVKRYKDVFLVPASEDYFGFVTSIHG